MEDNKIVPRSKSHWEMVDDASTKVSNSPQELWTSARNYFKWCDDNPIVIPRSVSVGRDAGKSYKDLKIRPYNIKALCLHCNVTEEYMNDIKNSGSGDWAVVVRNIVWIVYSQLFEMAMIGEFSPAFTSKALSMDKIEEAPRRVVIEYIGDLPELSTSEEDVLLKIEIEKGELIIGNDKNVNR